MGKSTVKKLLAAAAAVALAPLAASAINVTTFGPAVYDTDEAAMDSALGVTGFVIERFEDLALEPGLSISMIDKPAKSTLDGDDEAGDASLAWDSLGTLVETFYGDDEVTLYFDSSGQGAAVVGIGISQINPANPIRLVVNGDDFGRIGELPLFDYSAVQRNGYLMLSGEGGETITSVGFVAEDGISPEGIQWDHLAFTFQDVPEPSSFVLFGLAAVGLVGYGWRRCGGRSECFAR